MKVWKAKWPNSIELKIKKKSKNTPKAFQLDLEQNLYQGRYIKFQHLSFLNIYNTSGFLFYVTALH